MPTTTMNESVATLWVFGYEFIRIGSAFRRVPPERGRDGRLFRTRRTDEWDGGIVTPSLAVLDHSTGINAGQRGPGGSVRPIVGGGFRAAARPFRALHCGFRCFSMHIMLQFCIV